MSSRRLSFCLRTRLDQLDSCRRRCEAVSPVALAKAVELQVLASERFAETTNYDLKL